MDGPWVDGLMKGGGGEGNNSYQPARKSKKTYPFAPKASTNAPAQGEYANQFHVENRDLSYRGAWKGALRIPGLSGLVGNAR